MPFAGVDLKRSESSTVVAIGDAEGLVHAFVLDDGTVAAQDGTAWFAGWASDPPAYDPD
jgi:hypothetical protein